MKRGSPRPFYLVVILCAGMVCLAACETLAASPMTPSPEKNTPDANTIRLANGSWEPYNGPGLPHGGCEAQVVEEAFALQGITVEFGFFPWARSYSLSATGAWDGTLAWDDTPEHRADHYLSAEPITLQEWVFFYLKGRPLDWKTLDDLSGKTIGVTTGYVYSDAFKDIKARGMATFLESSSDEANFRMLLAGRIDVFPMERRVGKYMLQSIFSSEEQAQISESTESFSQFQSYLLLSRAVPENEQRMVLFDRGFQELKESGRYAEIMDKCAP